MVDRSKVAVLAALNIATEMFQTRKRQQEIEGPGCARRVEKSRFDGGKGAGADELEPAPRARAETILMLNGCRARNRHPAAQPFLALRKNNSRAI